MLFKTKYLINSTDTLIVTKFMYSCMFKLIKKLINTLIASTRQLLHHLKAYWKFLLNLKSINDAIFFKEIWNGTGGLLCIFINKTNFLQDLSIQHGKTSCEDQIIICCIHIFLLSGGFLQLALIKYICIFSDSLRDCIYLSIQNMYYDENALTTNFISDTTNILYSF